MAINTYAIVGAYEDDTIGTDNGYVYSFSRKGGILQILLHNNDINNNKYIYGNYNSSYYSDKQSISWNSINKMGEYIKFTALENKWIFDTTIANLSFS